MSSRQVLDHCENLTFRKLDYWCRTGVFDNDKSNPGRYNRRTFNEEDLLIARVLARISSGFDQWSNGRGGLVAIYKEVATQIRAGADHVTVTLCPGVELTATVEPLEPDLALTAPVGGGDTNGR